VTERCEWVTNYDLDLGRGHRLVWTEDGEGNRCGAIILHRAADGVEIDDYWGGWCMGSIQFRPTRWQREHPNEPGSRAMWMFDGNFEAPTFTPSILVKECRCGKDMCHGFITAGRWVDAGCRHGS